MKGGKEGGREREGKEGRREGEMDAFEEGALGECMAGSASLEF